MRTLSSYRVFLSLAALLVGVLAVVAVQSGVFENHSTQPIAFNHQKHIQNNVKCLTCHPYYAEYAVAGIPGVGVCVQCHEDVIYMTPDKEKIQTYYRNGEEIPWKQLFSVPPGVYFSHKRHVTFGGIACVKCHGEVTKWTTPPVKPAIPVEMNRCIECHKTMKEKTAFADVYNCNRCHR